MPQGQQPNAAPGGFAQGWSYFGGIGPIRGATIPRSGMVSRGPSSAAPSNAPSNAPPAAAPGYSGPGANISPLGEPFAVWLGMLLLLFLLKYLTEAPHIKILGKDVNPAFIRVGGYNWLTIGVCAATFTVVTKVIFNRVHIPGVTEFVNAA